MVQNFSGRVKCNDEADLVERCTTMKADETRQWDVRRRLVTALPCYSALEIVMFDTNKKLAPCTFVRYSTSNNGLPLKSG